MTTRTLIVVDTETNGLDPNRHVGVEVGWWRTARRVAIWIAVAVVALFAVLATRVIKVSDTIGPGGYTDGKDHQEVEITVVDQIGYKFSDKDPGWFRPICSGRCAP